MEDILQNDVFNSVKIDDSTNVITKVSSNNKYMVKLLFWSLYLSSNISLVFKFFVVSIWFSFS